jgi:hypothetical protein
VSCGQPIFLVVDSIYVNDWIQSWIKLAVLFKLISFFIMSSWYFWYVWDTLNLDHLCLVISISQYSDMLFFAQPLIRKPIVLTITNLISSALALNEVELDPSHGSLVHNAPTIYAVTMWDELWAQQSRHIECHLTSE